MTSLSRVRAGLVAVAALVALLSGCADSGTSGSGGTGAAAGEPVRGGTLRLAYNTGTTTLDPARCGSESWQPCQAIFGTLLEADPATGAIRPGMAESFTSTDGVTWTLTLRPGLTFMDGTPFDSDAVVANWARVKDPLTLSAAITTASTMSWSVVDPRTVRVVLDRPNYQLPKALDQTLGMIASPTALREKGKDFGNAPVGAGPFVLQSWQRETQMTLSRNPGYWDQPRPYLDTLVLSVIPADDQRVNALDAGLIDAMSTLVTEYAVRAERAGFTRIGVAPFGGTGVRMSWRSGDLADPDVREAVSRAIDTTQIHTAFFPDEEVPATFSPAASRYHDPAATYVEPDLGIAQQKIDAYLARTGKDAVRLSFKITAGVPILEQISQMLQAQLQRVRGLLMTIVPQEVGAYFGDLAAGNFELLSVGMIGGNPDDLYDSCHSGAARNSAGYVDRQVDAALEKARAAADPAAADAAYGEAMRRLAATFGLRPWFYITGWLVTDPNRVRGMEPAGTYFTRPERIWLQT
jgi:peptide/nickel transport system substrate-binding protein